MKTLREHRGSYTTSRDATLTSLQDRIASEGYAAAYLSCQNTNGHWGRYYYQPKWTSAHYALLDLKNLCVPCTLAVCRKMVTRMLDECMTTYGGCNLSRYEHPSDICVDGMILNYAAYFCGDDQRLTRMVDHLLRGQKADGGFTWDLSSDTGCPHTTVCVLEGLAQYCSTGSTYRRGEIQSTMAGAMQFLLENRLFFEHSDKRFKKLSCPYRYRYDLLRGLEGCVTNQVPLDRRMDSALAWLATKRQKDGRWPLENVHRGSVHCELERVREPSRFITLKAIVILSAYAYQW